MTVEITTLEQAKRRLDSTAIDEPRARVRGAILTLEDAEYDTTRRIWNAMIDKRPALIVRCAGAADVGAAVRFAAEHELLLSVRGGGHNVAGTAICEGGVMIDLSLLKGIRVDPQNRTVRAEPGLTWKELDHETLAFGLVTTGGTVSHTGIAGLTLGGGLGWLMSRQGATCDNLLSADIVTADGKFLTASQTQNEDLFWALRGGGGNFGVVTSFEYRLHPMNATIVGGMILYPAAQAKEVLQFYRNFSAHAPDELTVFAGMLNTPDGLPVVAVIPFWTGAVEAGMECLKPLREFGAPLADLIGEIPYAQQQTLFDAAAPFGMRRYWKGGYCAELPDDLLDLLIQNMAKNPSPYSLLLFFQIHGAVTRVGLSETPFTARQNLWDVDIISQWQDAADDEKNLGWARNFWRQLEPYTRGAYLNHFDADDGAARVRLAYGQNYERLAALKRKYDPANLFRMNNNIAPAQ